jgi:hypothetical protein
VGLPSTAFSLARRSPAPVKSVETSSNTLTGNVGTKTVSDPPMNRRHVRPPSMAEASRAHCFPSKRWTSSPSQPTAAPKWDATVRHRQHRHEATFNSGNFGLITNTLNGSGAPGLGFAEPRNAQVALKLLW